METGVNKLKQIVPIIPKYVISTDGCYLTEQLNNQELIQVNDGEDAKYNIEGIDGSTLIPVELGGRLIQPSISINELGKQLLKASAEGNIDEIKLLMNKGAPFTADWLGTSPLHFAAQNNHLEVCEILLRAGISKDARTKVDRTPLHMATYEGHIDIVRCLLQNKADIDCKDLLSMTPLHWAVQNSHAEVVELLLRHGARKDGINKFDLTAMDIAHQCKRRDIIELLNKTVPDAEMAVQHLTVQMSEIDNSGDCIMYPTVETFHSRSNSPNIPLETVLEDADNENSIDPDRLYMKSEALDEITEFTTAEEEVETKFSESMKLLKEHGITMLPADDSNILSSIIETGHSVVLTEVGKEVLNSTKPVEASSANVNNIISKGILPVLTPKVKPVTISKMPKKIITMSSDEFLAMTLNKGNVLKQLNGKINSTRPGIKRVVMKRNKVVPITSHSHKQENSPDVELLMKQLIETRKLVEEYKQKFLKKEAEAEQYKQQLLLIAQSRNIC